MEGDSVSIRRIFTKDEFVDEILVGGFVATCKFWDEVCRRNPDEMRRNGDAILRGIAALAFEKRNGTPRTPEEEEAFRHCGVNGSKPKQPDGRR
jgi:hypothetical protein